MTNGGEQDSSRVGPKGPVMNALIKSCRDKLLATPNTVCLERARLVTEAWQRFEGEPMPLLRAKAFQHVLAGMTLDVDTNPILAGNMSSRPRAWMLLPEYGFTVPDQAIIENPTLAGFLDGSVIPDDLRSYWAGRSWGGAAGVGHLAVDLTTVLSEGLEAIVDDAERRGDDTDPAKADYRQAIAICCRAVIDWAGRYARAAEEAAKAAADQQTRDLLLRVADACSHVPAKPARNLFEAIQAITLCHLAIHIEGHGYSVSPGLLDRVLLPYYEDKAETTELLAAFMLKLTANSIWGSHSKTQAITLGGLDPDAADACNPLTLRFLDACEFVRVPDPHVFLRWHSRIDARVKRRAVELLGAGLSMPMLVGDEQTIAGFVNAGIPAQDASGYCVIGCNELGIPGKLADSASGPVVNDLAVFNDALVGIESADTVRSMSELAAIVRGAYRAHITRVLANRKGARARAGQRVPTPFTSALMDGCLDRGCDLAQQMRFSLPVVFENGFTNVVNSLAAIEHAVFRKKSIGLADVIRGMKDNLSDHLVRAALWEAPKWGSDDDRVDKWGIWWSRARTQEIRRAEGELGLRLHVAAHLVRSMHHIRGKGLGASPDCRPADAPLADSIGAQTGTAFEGPTALLNSVLKLQPSKHWQGGYNLNLTLPPVAASDETALRNLGALIETFFAEGGQEIQIGCLDARQLREACANPERHRDLLVRIAGFNAIFVDLSPVEQEELISRAEALRP